MHKHQKSLLIAATLLMSLNSQAQSLLCANGPDVPGLLTGTTSNSGTVAPAGTEWSEVQNDSGNTTESNTLSGVSCSVTATVFRCADDFIVPVGGWDISSVATHAYQTGFVGEVSPITGMTVQIFGPCADGLVPGDVGCDLVAGDTTTNVLTSSTDISAFRIFNSSTPAPGTTPGTLRKIWVNEAAFSPSISLMTPGRYWVDFNTNIDSTSAHFAPLVTIPGVRALSGWNAVQLIDGNYETILDVGNPDVSAPDLPMDLPYEIYGTGSQTPIGLSCVPPDLIFADGFEVTTL